VIVTVYLWQAGSAEGVTDDEVAARELAASHMKPGAAPAVVEQALLVIGFRVSCYQKLESRRWEARRDPAGEVTWRQCPARELTAA